MSCCPYLISTSSPCLTAWACRVYSNPALIVFTSVAEVVALIWVVAMALSVLHRSKHIHTALIFPGLDHGEQRAPMCKRWLACLHHVACLHAVDGTVARIALELSVAHAACVLVYIATFWHLSSTNDDSYSVPFSPLWLQFVGFVLPLGLTVTPFMSGWPLRQQFWRLFGECASCVVGWSPLAEVQFRHVLLTDVMTSAMPLVSSVSYSICHLASSSWLSTRIDQATNVSWTSALTLARLSLLARLHLGQHL